VNEEFMALEFGCFLCLRGESPPGEEEPPVGVVH
jgi:hypothetical protein